MIELINAINIPFDYKAIVYHYFNLDTKPSKSILENRKQQSWKDGDLLSENEKLVELSNSQWDVLNLYINQ